MYSKHVLNHTSFQKHWCSNIWWILWKVNDEIQMVGRNSDDILTKDKLLAPTDSKDVPSLNEDEDLLKFGDES